jgi:hypothetical protein
MNLFLRPLNDVNDVTWSIIWMLVILLAGVIYINDTPESEELLQLPSDRDQQSS